MLEKGWIGGGNTGRNTTIIRSNYLFDESAALYDHALKLWEGLSQALNYNVMFSQRGVMMLAHNLHDHAERASGTSTRTASTASTMSGSTPRAGEGLLPAAQHRRRMRYPVLGAALQRRGGVARHDAVAWGYARAADARGVDIIQNCEVTAIRRGVGGAVDGGRDHARLDRARKVGSRRGRQHEPVMAMAGLRMPLESYPLQALVSEPVKPIFPCVVMSNTIHAYVSQSDKGELVIGAGTDAYVSYTQRGGLHVAMHTLEAICELFPMFRRMRMLRNWGGIVDVTPDRSPIIGKTPVAGLYVNCGWGTGGFKATPGSGHLFAWTHRRGRAASDQRAFRLDRFRDAARSSTRPRRRAPVAH